MVGRELWFELNKFQSDLVILDLTDEEKLERALKLLKDIYIYEHTAKYN